MGKSSKEKKHKKTKINWSVVMTIVGGILIFLSWAVENKLDNELLFQLERITNFRDLYQHEASLAELNYKHLLQEVNKYNPNELYLIDSYAGYLSHTFYKLATIKNALREDDEPMSAEEKAYRVMFGVVEEYKISKDLESLEKLYLDSVVSLNEDSANLTAEITILYNSILKKEKIYNDLFFGLYIFGALISGIGFVISNKNRILTRAD